MALPSAPLTGRSAGTTSTVPKFTLGSPARSRRYTPPKVTLPPLGSGRSSGLGKVTLGQASVAPTEAPRKPRSLWEQVNPVSLAAQAVRGVSTLAKEALIETPLNLAAANVDAARGLGLPIPGKSREMDWSGNPLQDIQASFRTYNPLLADISSSVLKTGNVTGIGSQKNIIGRYQQAVDEGNWVDTMLEDVGNVAIVAGGTGKALGSLAGASLAPESASALLRRAAARDTTNALLKDAAAARRAPTSGAMLGETKALSSQWRPPMRMLPPEVPRVTDLSLRIPGTQRTALPLVERVEDSLRAQAATIAPGRGLAGALERQALPDMSDAARVASRADGVGAPPVAQAVANAGAQARRLSLTAQWMDPSESMIALAGKGLGAAGRATGKLVGPRLTAAAAAAGSDPTTGRASWSDRAQQRVMELSTEGAVRQDMDTNRMNMEREAIQFQNFVDSNLKRQGIDQAQRDLYGGIILDATDLSLDARAKVWRRMANDPPEMREATLRLWNEGRGDKFAITADRLDLYNDYLDGKLDPAVAEVLGEGLNRLRAAELNRRHTQQAVGNLLGEQLEQPHVVRDYGDGPVKVPYTELSPAEISAALADGSMVRPWLATKVAPRQARLAEIIGQRETAVTTARESLGPVARQLDTVVAMRNALPAPGTSVNWWDTMDGRARIIDEGHRRIDALEATIEDAIATAELDADLTAEIGALREQIRDIDAEIAATQDIADFSAEQMLNAPEPRRPPVDVSRLDDGEAIREAAEQYQQEMHAAAVSEHDANFGESPPNLTPPKRRKADGKWETQADWGGTYDTFRHDSPIWSNRRARRWYTMQGWFSKGGRAQGLAPDEWATVVARRNPLMAGKSLDEMAVAYLDSIDRIYATRSKKAFRGEVVETLADQLDMDPRLVDAALSGKRAYTAAQRATVEQALTDLSQQFGELDPQGRARIIADLRSLDADMYDADTRMTALMEMLSDELGVAERELFGEILGRVDVDGLVNMLDSGEIPEAAWRSAMEQIELSTEQRTQIQALIDRATEQVSGVDQGPIIRQSLAAVAEAKLDMPDPVVGTNPTTGKPWEPGTWDVGVQERAAVVAAGAPDINSGPIRPDAENIIRQEADLRRQVDEIERDIWIAEKELSVARERADTFIDALDVSQQEMLLDNANRGVAALHSTVQRINTSGDKVGGYMLDADGNGKLVGGLGKMARKLNLEARVMALTELRLARMWERMHERLDPADYPQGVPTLDQFIDIQRKRLTEREQARVAFEVLTQEADKFKPGTRQADMWKNDRGALESAFVADDLGRTAARFFNRGTDMDSPMAAHAAMRAIDQKINSLPRRLRNQIGDDRINEIRDTAKANRDRFHRELSASIERNVTMAPAVFRTPLEEARRMVSSHLTEADRLWAQGNYGAADALYRLVEDAPTSFAMYVEQGGAVPIHLIAGDGSGVPARAVAKNAPAEVNVAKVKATQERQLGYRVPSLREYAGIEAREMTQIASQQSVLALAFDPTFSKAAADIPGVREAVVEWHRAHAPGEKMPFRAYQKILADKGYAVVKGATEDTQPGVRGRIEPIRFNEAARLDIIDSPGDPLQRIVIEDPITGERILRDYDTLDEVNTLPNVRVVPDYIAPVINDFLTPTSNRWLLMYDQMTQLWKTATLAWSVAWVTYNAIGNAIMATFSYGQGPLALVNNLSTIRSELAKLNDAAGYGSAKPLRTAMMNDTLSALVPDRMGAHGQSWAERASTMRVRDFDTRLGKALDYATTSGRPGAAGWMGKVTEFSYTLNEFTDNMFRTTVLMEDAARRLAKDAAIPPELLTKDGRIRTDLNPGEQAQMDQLGKASEAALEKATHAALNTMGDFTRLNRYERNVIKRVFPFYPWLRHQTAMAFRIPIQNPLRWAWMASLQSMLQDEDDPQGAMANLMSSMWMTPLGGVSLQAANPLSKGMTSFGSEEDGKAFFDPGSLAAAVNPIPKLAAQLITGVDANQLTATSRPTEQKTLNAFGQLEGTSALGRIFGGDVMGGLGEVGYQALGLVPQTRGLRDTALGPKPRYDSGDVIDYADPRPGGRVASLARAARIPFMPTDVTQLVETAEQRDAEARRAARRWQLAAAASSG